MSNARFTRALAAALSRPAVLPVPLPALRLVLGSELVDDALLSDQAVLPDRLLNDSYRFLDTQFEPALDRLLANE